MNGLRLGKDKRTLVQVPFYIAGVSLYPVLWYNVVTVYGHGKYVPPPPPPKRSCRILFKNDVIKKDTDLIFKQFDASGNNSSMSAIFSLKIWISEYAMRRDTRTN
jgi:hypothetical protein